MNTHAETLTHLQFQEWQQVLPIVHLVLQGFDAQM